MVESAVLFVTFARPEYARQTFDAIKRAQPKKLYFYSNKAREDNLDEVERNNRVRALVDEVDWECDLKTFFREEYVDVYTSLWGAYDWVFDNEEQAICFEEDCVPSRAFFDFCDQLLPKYKDDQRVWVLSGNNFIEGYNPSEYDYTFSHFPFMYGWASWANRWYQVKKGDAPINEIRDYRLYEQLFVRSHAWKKRFEIAQRTFNSRAWDYKFHLSMNMNGGMAIVPNINLVSNIGIDGVHNKKGKKNEIIHCRNLQEADRYLIKRHPRFMVADLRYDTAFAKYMFKDKPIKAVVKKILRYVKA